MSISDYVRSINDGVRIDVGTDYSQYAINEIFSYYADCIYIVARINDAQISDQMHYDFMLGTVRPRKRPFVKISRKKRTPADVLLISQYYKYSDEKAKKALSVMTDQQLTAFKNNLGIEA